MVFFRMAHLRRQYHHMKAMLPLSTKCYFKDDLGYSVNSQDETFTYNVTSSEDEAAPTLFVDTVNSAYSDEYVNIEAVFDDETGIENVTLSYSIGPKAINQSVPMKLEEEGAGMYLATIPPVGDNNKNTTVNYYVAAYDRAGLKGEHHGFYNITAEPRQYSDLLDIKMRVKELDVRSLSSKIEITIEGYNINKSSLQQDIPIFVTNADVNADVNETFTIQPKIEPLLPSISAVRIVESTLSNDTFSLFGNPSPFPFDKYHLNFVVAIPTNELHIMDTVKFDQIINATWNPAYETRDYTMEDAFIKNLCFKVEEYHIYDLCDREDFIFENIKITFERNFVASLAILFPVISIFFLIGAVFIFDNTIENVPNRLLLTLGIFALIFTLPDYLDAAKPLSPYSSIAEYLLGAIMLATIVFSISSVLSISPVIVHKLKNKLLIVDAIAFLAVAAISITAFLPSFFYFLPVHISIIISLILLLGLGYGLGLRIMGMGITYRLLERLSLKRQ